MPLTDFDPCCSVPGYAKDHHEGMADSTGREDGQAETRSRARHLKPVGLREERVEIDVRLRESFGLASLSSVVHTAKKTSLILWTIKSVLLTRLAAHLLYSAVT